MIINKAENGNCASFGVQNYVKDPGSELIQWFQRNID